MLFLIHYLGIFWNFIWLCSNIPTFSTIDSIKAQIEVTWWRMSIIWGRLSYVSGESIQKMQGNDFDFLWQKQFHYISGINGSSFVEQTLDRNLMRRQWWWVVAMLWYQVTWTNTWGCSAVILWIDQPGPWGEAVCVKDHVFLRRGARPQHWGSWSPDWGATNSRPVAVPLPPVPWQASCCS